MSSTPDFIPYAEEPQKKDRKPSVWDLRLDRLKSFPSGWYVVGHFEKSITQAANYRITFSRKEKYKEFKFQAQQTDNGGSKLYARYLPNDILEPELVKPKNPKK